MTSTGPALLAAAAGLGFAHAVLPDHWVPLALLGRARRYRLTRVARLSALAGTAHVAVSILLGAMIIAVGLRFRSTERGAQDAIVGSLLILAGLGYALAGLAGHGHGHGGEDGHHHPHEHEHEHEPGGRHGRRGQGMEPGSARERLRAGIETLVPFGAAASPDLTILPVFLAASTVGVVTAVSTLLTFAAATVATFVGLTVLACFGGHQLSGRWLERWGGALTSALLVLIGLLVVIGTI
jgi:nickel/cobalt transporter (NicO) family protein